jgi:palmitoyltransferase ZDHHC9/14/18
MAWQMGWPILLIGGTSFTLLLFFYSMTVCSDPGIIYKNDYDNSTELNRLNGVSDSSVDDIESSRRKDGSNDGITIRTNGGGSNSLNDSPPNSFNLLPVPREPTIECGQCNLHRPTYARHCSYCGVCIENLDHHCPWSGKCIGKKNMFAFTCFISLLCFQVYFLLGTLVYYFIAFYANDNGIPKGKPLN